MFRRNFFEFEKHSRLFEKGDLKYVILDLIKDKPAHGYEIIRQLEQRFHGFYTPSAGSIYPTLQLLEDMGYVKSAEQDGKKVYTITDEGRNFLKERGETVDKIREQVHNWWGSENREAFRDAMHEIRDMAHTIGRKAQGLDADKLTKIKAIIAKACRDIEEVIDQG